MQPKLILVFDMIATHRRFQNIFLLGGVQFHVQGFGLGVCFKQITLLTFGGLKKNATSGMSPNIQISLCFQ